MANVARPSSSGMISISTSSLNRIRPVVATNLTISERAVRAHGGTIRARNGDAGGLEVEMTLPTTGDES